MMGLLIKDLLCLRRQVKVYVIATVVYGGMTLMGVWDVSFFTWFFTLIAAMIPLSLFALDAAAKWDTPSPSRWGGTEWWLHDTCLLCWWCVWGWSSLWPWAGSPWLWAGWRTGAAS